MIQENLFKIIDDINAASKLSSEYIDNPAILKDIPFEKIYEAARKEASRKKPVFFIHKYFARRVTCNFRMILLAMLLPYGEDIWKYYYKSIKVDDNDDLTILDPFMGGGTTLFESIRLNSKVIGNDLQPLSKYVTTALVSDIPEKKVSKALKELEKTVGEKIKSYYKTTCPVCSKEADVMYNFHVKTAISNTFCKKHELFSGFVLALKKDEFTVICPKCKDVYKTKFENGIGHCPNCRHQLTSPKKSYVNAGTFICEDCSEKIELMDLKGTNHYPFETDIIAQEYYCPHCGAHDYKSVDEKDNELYEKAKKDFDALEKQLPIPQQEIPYGYNTKQILNHGYKYFKDLFNKRQLLSLGLLLKAIDEYKDDEVKFWLLLAFSGSLEMNNMFCRYQHNASKISNIFFNHAYVPITMPVENNVWGAKLGTGNFIKTIDKILRGKKFNKEIYDLKTVPANNPSKFDTIKVESSDEVVTRPTSSYECLSKESPLITYGDSRNLSHIPDESVDLVVTDPPYGGNIMYSELIDFFHVWNHSSSYGKTIGFIDPLTTKSEEIIVNPARNLSHLDYQNGLTKVFLEANRVTKGTGFLTFSFHDRDLESWYSIINSLNESGYRLVAAYPLHSETRTGAHTSNKNSIAFDIFLVCRKATDINKHSSSLNEIARNALEKTEEYVERLKKVGAEITIPDIENIFISQFFVKASELGISVPLNSEIVKAELSRIVSSIDELFSKYNATQVRSGWWSELYKKKWNID